MYLGRIVELSTIGRFSSPPLQKVAPGHVVARHLRTRETLAQGLPS
jgi:hypothetical protein